MIPILRLAAAMLVLAGCTEPVTRDDTSRILLIGDSLMAMHGLSGQSVSHAVEKRLGEPVTDRAVMGARFLYALPISGAAGLNITKQYRPGDWEWVIVNGGGNDLWLGCGCSRCHRRLDRLIAADGQDGEIAEFVRRVRAGGAQVIFVGYLRSPGAGSPIEHCREEGDALEGRVAQLARTDPGVHFVSLSDLVPEGDTSYHAVDMIHPSVKASRAIGARVARVIREQGETADPPRR
ncbi:SGNH/GDSL hydrolase family protein [Roseovarius salinarum]|uniref:SGNH/GDSL hydrolase family protein n=1 Tax=Roseovarius salinarum TaxID=1981892 RepID=UPI001E36798B|nr:SGNH/GDSL hydrolase family protein [Roseovarius salinarum]